jgi:hypothetical protein
MKRPLGRLRYRCECSVKMDPEEIELDVMDLIDLAQDRDQ